MILIRIVVRLSVAGLVLITLPGVASADSIPTTPMPYCGGAVTTRCVVSVTADGVAVGAADPNYGVNAYRYTYGGAKYFKMDITDKPGMTSTIDPAVDWVVTINTGSAYPETVFMRGQSIQVSRGGNLASGYTITMSANSVRMDWGGCNSSGVCTGPATTGESGVLTFTVDDLGYVTDPEYKAAQHNFSLASNADWVSTPLQLDPDTKSIVLDVGNSHYRVDGSTLFTGRAEFILPNSMLTNLYKVDDPASLTSAAFKIGTGSGSETINVDVNPGSVYVDISGMSFSKRRIRIAGQTSPKAPRNVRASRVQPTRAIIAAQPSTPRGSKIRGYRATCTGNGHTVTAVTRRSSPLPIRVRGLMPGTAYTCAVQARSKAGPSKARGVKIPANPS